MAERRQWLVPSVQVVLFALVFWQALFFMPQMLNADGDLPRHLAVGEYILQTAQIPTRDIFSHTLNGAPLVPHEWLSEVLFATAHRVSGLNGVAWLTALVIALTYTALTYILRDLGVRALVALGGAYAASVVGALHQLPRPHIFTTLFFTLFLLVLERYRRTGNWRALIWLLPLMVVWANAHGAFLFGFILVALYAAGALLERNRQRLVELIGLTGALFVISLINPFGLTLWTHAFAATRVSYIVNITSEYQSPDFHGLNTLPFLALLLFSLALGWRAQQKLGWTEIILLCAWTAFALYTARNIPLYAQVALIVLAPIADCELDAAFPRIGRAVAGFEPAAQVARGEVWGVVIVAVLIALEANGAALDVWRKGNVFDAHVFPIAAVDALKENLPAGKMFNEFNWGGYLLYRLWPQEQVFIDGQTDFYGEALTRKYVRAINGEAGWEQVLREYDARWVIIPPTRPLADRLENSANWLLKYQDETAKVWVRK